MTWPASDVVTTNADASTDSPATFRTDVLDLLQKFNLLRNHFSTLAQTLVSRATAGLMRTDLGAAASGSNSDITSWGGGPLAGFRNLLINGSMAIDQRNAGAPKYFTAAAALSYAVDRWYGYCVGANVVGQRVWASSEPTKYNYQFTGAASVSKIGFAQRIEAANSQHLAGCVATLSVDLANSLLSTVTWTAWYANTTDAFGTLASPTRTQIATGTFTVSNTLTRCEAQITIPSAANTGIEIELSVGAQTGGTWTIGRAQLEQGSIATAFEGTRPNAIELLLCQRYYVNATAECGGYIGGAASAVCSGYFPAQMRATPTRLSSSVLVSGNVNGFAVSYQVVDSLRWKATCPATSTTPSGFSFSAGIEASAEL